MVATGLTWRTEVCQQVFEEAAVDLGRGLRAWSDSRSGERQGKRVGFPKFKKKIGASAQSFRLRNKHRNGGPPAIRVGDNNRPRSITLPGIGQIAVHDDTRRLRRMLANGRATILFATITRHAGRWWVSLDVEAADVHPARQHPARSHHDTDGWIGIDRGLSTFLVASSAAGDEVARIPDARWSRPTTGLSLKTLTWPECWPTPAWPRPSPMPPGPSSLDYWATSRHGAAANSCLRIGGIPPADSAHNAAPSIAI